MPAYTGIILDEASRKLLVEKVWEHLEPLLAKGWVLHNNGKPPSKLPHHMTIVFGKSLPPEQAHLLGTVQPMTVFMWGESDKAAAVAVRSPVQSANDIPHITVAVSPTGKPFHSNMIEPDQWILLDDEFTLTGTVEEV